MERSGFAIRYGTAHSLVKEHQTSLSKGGMLIPWADSAPPENTQITVRIESPTGTLFDLIARVGQSLQGRGFLVSFEGDVKKPLDHFVRCEAMNELLSKEDPESAAKPPEVSALAAEEERTDPNAKVPAELRESFGGDVPDGFRHPDPGEEYIVYVVKFHGVREFNAIKQKFRETCRFEVAHSEPAENVGKIVQFRLTLPGHNVYEMWGFIEKIEPDMVTLLFDENNERFRQACNYVDTPHARNRMKSEAGQPPQPPVVVRLLDKVPEEDADKMPIRRRLQRMGMDDKINMALSGDREERMALATDGNKAIHHYLLRNAKISLDEIGFMARLPTMNPDVLEKIAENPQYTQNPTVTKALVYNPKTPVLTAIRLLDRLPRNEIMLLAKRVNMNSRLIQAAKKKMEKQK